MSVVVAVVIGSAGVVASLRTLQARRRTIESRTAGRELPGAVFDLSRAVRSGATFDMALREIAPHADGKLGRELRGVVALLDRGYGIGRTLEVWRRATSIDGVELLAAACRFSVGRNTGLVGALDGVASTLLDRIEVDDEVAALASQARTSTMVLMALPPGGAAVFALLDPSFAEVLFATTAGRLCLGVGVALDLLGARSSRALVNRMLSEASP